MITFFNTIIDIYSTYVDSHLLYALKTTEARCQNHNFSKRNAHTIIYSQHFFYNKALNHSQLFVKLLPRNDMLHFSPLLHACSSHYQINKALLRDHICFPESFWLSFSASMISSLYFIVLFIFRLEYYIKYMNFNE